MITTRKLLPATACALLALTILLGRIVAGDSYDATPSAAQRYPGPRSPVAGFAAQAEADTSQNNYDVYRYDIDLRIVDTVHQIISGAVTLHARVVADTTDAVLVDLGADMAIDSVYGSVAERSYDRMGDQVRVNLDRLYTGNEIIGFTIAYRGRPRLHDGMGLEFGTHPKGRVISTLSEPFAAHSWWPCKDRVDDKADTFEIAVEVPDLFYVASNGRHDSTATTTDSTHTFYYSTHHPMATYLFSLAIAEYSVRIDTWVYESDTGTTTMPIVHAMYPGTVTQSYRSYAHTGRYLTGLSDFFGVYPFADEKYGHAHYQWIFAMEHQTMSSMPAPGDAGGNDALRQWAMVHELAHQWFGNYVTCSTWHDIWLHEGWATYAEALIKQIDSGWGRYHQYMGEMRDSALRPGTIHVEETASAHDVLLDKHAQIYEKAAWVIHMLRGKLGDEHFKAGIREYLSSHAYGNATTDDFIEAFVQATDDTSLRQFIRRWVYSESLPQYRWSYLEGPPDNEGVRTVYMYVEQEPDSAYGLLRMPVEFAFQYHNGDSGLVRFDVDSAANRLAAQVPDGCDTVILDPHDWILCEKENIPWTMHIGTVDTLGGPPDQAVGVIDSLFLSLAYVDRYYEDTIHALGGSAVPVFKEVTENGLPPGFTLSSGGVVRGITQDTGHFRFDVSASDTVFGWTDEATVSIVVKSADQPLLPDHHALHQNFPNPFNQGTTISFDVARAGPVQIEVFNVLGRRVRTLASGQYGQGAFSVSWDGRDYAGNEVASGVYLYRMEVGEFRETRKMVLVR